MTRDWSVFIGIKIGRLTAKSFEIKNGNSIAKCNCDCGNKNVEVQATRWKAGLVFSCGCIAREIRRKKIKKI